MKPRPSRVIAVENIEVATSVIRSLRASSSSQKRYQLYAKDDNVVVEGVNQLNNVIEKQKDRIREENSRQQRISDAINNFDGCTASPYGSPSGKTVMSLTLGQTPDRKNESQLKTEVSDSDEEGSLVKSKYDLGKSMNNNGEDSDDELLRSDGDMHALFSGFVPPSQATSMANSTSLIGKIGQVNSSKSKKLNPISTSALDTAAMRSGSVIKPGQAIRVKSISHSKQNRDK